MMLQSRKMIVLPAYHRITADPKVNLEIPLIRFARQYIHQV
jgi:hypothetical protein